MKRGSMLAVLMVLMLTLLVGCGSTTTENGTTDNTNGSTTTENGTTDNTNGDTETDFGSADPNGDGIVGNDGAGYDSNGNNVIDDAEDAADDVVDGVDDAADDVTDNATNANNRSTGTTTNPKADDDAR